MRRKINKNTFFCIMLIIPIAIICKLAQFSLLPNKYFNDSNYILSLLIKNIEVKGTAYYMTGEIFRRINFFGFTSLQEWAYMLALILNPILIHFLLKKNKYNVYELIFIFANVILLNIFVFNLSKDVIQFLIFLIIYLVSKNLNLTDKKKIILISAILLGEALFFRSYYIIILFGFIVSNYLLKSNPDLSFNIKSSIPFMLKIFICFIVMLFISQRVFPTAYQNLIDVRNDVTSLLDVNTIIRNLLNGDNLIIFALNYIINGFRILFPIELLFIGIKYLPFVIYQIYFSYLIIYSIRHLNCNNKIYISLIIGYLMGSFVFEPDFGSVVRHESTLFFILIELNSIMISNKRVSR